MRLNQKGVGVGDVALTDKKQFFVSLHREMSYDLAFSVVVFFCCYNKELLPQVGKSHIAFIYALDLG